MTIVIAVLSMLILVALHELGHFLFAKLFNVKVEEFGIGLPPRIAGKKIGETLYSINLLPLGAFVRMEGEEKRLQGNRSFSSKQIWQRMIIVAAGVVAFWLVAIALFSALAASSGIPMEVDDAAQKNISNPQVQIIEIASNSPAQNAKLLPGDTIVQIQENKPTTVKEVQDSIQANTGQSIALTIQRGAKTLEIHLTPRQNPPPGQGALGVVLARTAFVHFSWYEAPLEGIKITAQFTQRIAAGLWEIGASLVHTHTLPQGAQLSGPVGIVGMLATQLTLGPASFFMFVGILAVYLAIFNALPIPAADGGRLLFLLVELARRKPMSEKIEQRIIAVSFGILLVLFIYVSIKDIVHLF